MDSGFESTFLILSLRYTVNHNRTVKMSLSEQRAVMYFVTEGETSFSFPRLWAQQNKRKQCEHSITFANTDWLPRGFSSFLIVCDSDFIKSCFPSLPSFDTFLQLI